MFTYYGRQDISCYQHEKHIVPSLIGNKEDIVH